MFSKMSIWMTMSRLFSGLIKLREKCNRYMLNFQFTYNSNDSYRKSCTVISRAFDADQDGQLTFKEWRLGYQTIKLSNWIGFLRHLAFDILSPLPHILSASETPWNHPEILVPFSRQANSSSPQNSNKSSQISSPAALGQRRWGAQGEGGGLDKGDGGSIQVLEYKETKEQK